MSVIKKKHRKHLFIYILTLVFSVGGLFLLSQTFAQDLMEQAFHTARSYDAIIDLGTTKDAVWNEVLRESVTVWMNDNLWQGCFVNGQYIAVDETQCAELWGDRDIQAIDVSSKAPLLVRITKFLLRMTIVLSITMIIYSSVKYMVEVLNWKDWKSAAAKKDIARIAGWVIIALMSVGIINLIVSIPKSSITTSDDLSSFEIWCQVDATIIAGNELKQRVCENIFEGDWKNDRIWNRCRIDWEREPVRDDDMKSACINELWWTVTQ